MGIKNLFKFIKEKYPNSIKLNNLNELEFKKIAVDTPCLLYKYKFAQNTDTYIWLNNLLYFILNLMKNNIKVVFIFDGKPEEAKKSTLEKRFNIKQQSIERCNTMNVLLNNYKNTGVFSDELSLEWEKICKNKKCEFSIEKFEENILKKQFCAKTVTEEDIQIVKELLTVLNINYIISNNEAETLCCFLEKSNQVDYIYSHDSDVLAYNGVCGLIKSIDFKSKLFTYYDKKELLYTLFPDNLDIESKNQMFVKLCILAGTDYNKTLNRIGINKAFKYLIQNKKIQELCKTEKDFEDLNVEWITNKFNCKEYNSEIFKIDYNILWEEPKVLEFFDKIQTDLTVFR